MRHIVCVFSIIILFHTKSTVVFEQTLSRLKSSTLQVPIKWCVFLRSQFINDSYVIGTVSYGLITPY